MHWQAGPGRVLGGNAGAFAVTLAIACPALAGSPLETARFEHLTINDGLSQSSVNALAEDGRGYLWIGTQDGLDRYDGYRFEVFRNAPDLATSLAANNVSALLEDSRGDLWVGTSDGTVHRYLPEAEGFERMAPPRLPPGADRSLGSISALIETHDGDIWVGARNYGLLRVDPASRALRPVDGFPRDEVNCLLEPVPGELWVGSPGTGLTRWRMAAGALEPIGDGTARLPVHEVTDLVRTDDGRIWAGSNIGRIDRLDPRGAVLEPIRLPDPQGGTPYAVRSMLADSRGYVWIGLIGGGVAVYGTDGRLLARYLHSPSDPYTLSTDTAYALLEDRAGVVWVGSLAAGLSKTLPGGGGFTHLHNVPDDPSSLSHNMVTEFAEDPDGGIWVGSSGGGLSHLDTATGRFTNYRSVPDDPTTLSSDRVWGLYLGPDGMLWVGTWGAGLNRFDTRTGHVQRYAPQPDRAGGLPGAAITALVGDGRSGIYAGLVDGGLVHFEPAAGDFRRLALFDAAAEAHHPVNVSALLYDRRGRLWAGTWSQGVCVADTSEPDPSFRCHVHDPARARSINDDNIRSFAEDDDGTIWIATANGIARYDEATDAFDRFGSTDGLVPGVIYGIVPVGDGILWLSSNRGLMRYDTRTRQGRGYEYRDGLQANEFNGGAALRTRSGVVYFGGVGGITRFHPDALVNNPVPPKVAITAFSLFNKPVRYDPADPAGVLTRALPATREIRLEFDQNSPGFEFAGLHFVSPARNRYEYRLDGLDADWIPTDASRRFASYSNLDPGDYRFRVRAANSDGIWSTDEASIALHIVPPWWLTWWAKLGLLLASGLSLILFIEWRLGQLQLHTRQLEAEVSRRTAQIVEQRDTITRQASHLEKALEGRNRFFARLSHEFRTPITLMLGPIHDSLQDRLPERARHMLVMAMHNGERLLHLVDQLLSMAKHGGEWHLERQPIELGPEVRLVAAEFDSAARQKSIELLVDVIEDGRVISHADALQSIVINLVSNAIKYTEPGGKVRITVDRDEGGNAVVRVADTGIGIAPDEIGNVFDLFERGSAAGPGTGIGLTLVKELVDAHGGTINIASEPGSGTTVVVTLPTTDAPAVAHAAGAPVVDAFIDTPRDRVSPPASEGNASAPEILVIDDNADMRRFVRDLLSPEFRCREAEDGADGLAAAVEHIPDLVVCDVMMPAVDGFGVLHALRSNDHTSHIPIVLLTAKGDDASRLRGLAERADDYISKPFHPEELRLRIRNLLELNQMRAERIRQSVLEAPQPGSDPGAGAALAPRDRAFLERLEKALAARYADPEFHAESLSEALYMSHRQLQRKLRGLLDIAPASLIRHYRLRQARVRLEAGHSVTDAALASGFSSPGYFARCFKARFGMRPGDVRAREAAPDRSPPST